MFGKSQRHCIYCIFKISGTGVQLSGKKLHRNTRLAECDKYSGL